MAEKEANDWLDPETYIEGLKNELRYADKDRKALIQSEIDRVSKRTTVKAPKETR